MTREEQIAGMMKIARFFEARADMAVGDGKMLLLNWMKCAEDAAEWMREHEPRVMTLEEVLALNPYTPIYFQHRTGENGWDIYCGIDDDGTCDIVTGSLWSQGDYWQQKDYGKSYVCWTSCPTDEQREAVKWE